MATPVLETISDAEAKWDKGDAFVDERLKKSSSADDFLPLEPETTRNELWGWYLFAWAADGYTGATSSVFQPLIISAMATLGGRSTVDHNSSCTSATSCEVLFGNVWVSPTSYSLYSSAISVLAQAFVTISLAALADHSGYGKIYMFSFAGVTCVSVMLWLALEDPKLYYAANILNIVGNVCYGAAFVFYTSYIPKLARNHPEVLNAVTPEDRIEKLTFRTSRISIFGSATGYFGGFVQMLIAVGILLAMNQTLFSLKVATFIGGVWWGLFAIYPLFTLKRRPGPPLPKGEHFLTYSWKQLYKKVRQAKQLSQLFSLLIFWFFVSDSASTILKVAVLFAQNDVHVSSEKTLIGAVLDLFCAVPGMLFWHFLQKRFKLKPKTLIFGLTILTGAVPIYVLGGLSPLPGGFKTPNEFLGLCCYYGFVQPALFAFSRALFAQLIPRGHENKFFSLFSITQAGGGWIGPLITGVIGDATGQMRYSMIFVLASMYIPLGLLYFIDVGKGHEEAESFLANEIAEKQAQESMQLDSKA